MNKHAFDPELSVLYSPSSLDEEIAESGDQYSQPPDSALLHPGYLLTPTDGRHLFYQLNQPINDQNIISRAYAFVAQGLKDAEQLYSPLIIENYSVENLASLKVSTIKSLSEQLLTQDNLLECIKKTAAISLTQPCWLQNVSQISCSQTITAVQLTSIYLQLTQKEKGRLGLGDLYNALLLSTGTKIPALHSHGYSQQTDINPEIFDFATTQLALSRFPRVLFPEILGFTLAYCQMPTLIEICFPDQKLPSPFFKQRQQTVDKQLMPVAECIADYLDLFPQQQQLLWRRIQQGFWLFQLQMQRCRDQLNNTLAQSLSPRQAVAKLFQQKTVAAIGHHHKIQLQGVSLEQWFAGMPENSQALLQALKQSDYVDSQKPLDSPLLKLFGFKGPMFGVFDEAELLVLQNWLTHGLNDKATFSKGKAEQRVTSIPPQAHEQPQRNYAKLRNRELYYYLVNADLFPDVLPMAKAKAGKLLQLSALFNPLPFKHYSHQQFDAYIENIYQTEVSAYQPLQGIPKISKEAYIWGIEQIAPMILIDGCWLQNSLALQHISPEICKILFGIYCDEIGNGQLEQNHPYIFQQLLDSLSIQVPSVYSAEFIKHSGFINSAFDLPTYMLALSCHPTAFFPELLGLNMAIELSGLGKSYMHLVDEWNYWGIDPSIANLHITIDNYASGHTFLAKKAVQLYMDDVLKRTGDVKVLDKYWRRIYSGYASLRFVGERFKLSLPIAYLRYKFF